MYTLARELLFKLSPEASHELSIDLIGAGGRLGLNGLLTKNPAVLPVKVMGLEFPNPVGLAAGLDKNGVRSRATPSLGCSACLKPRRSSIAWVSITMALITC